MMHDIHIKNRSNYLKSTLILLSASGFVFITGTVHLLKHLTNILRTVSLYNAIGLSQTEVLEHLVHSYSLLILVQTLAVYIGLSSLLFAAAIINQKLASPAFEATASARAEKDALEAATVILALDKFE
ncbi:hypothetical protein [Acidaminobacter hydrogenoformans]|uniref:Uncharacterized protein n=1 Tax=Acidaminobacter hydrogenoformans DSM 2784 TaxID=1120920 RepID=A0A1G5S0Z8_9FIRM|nr:hypothetical protein [Acidaminobacter hydrogenoformans]SCZ80055.1 hypothetical protein SAMN03080599_02079 [Acidaminobacter hydrogenoformans DSM 2784]